MPDVLQAKILALDHQLSNFERSSRGRNTHLLWTDRVLLVCVARVQNDWPLALPFIVKPEIVITWHRRMVAAQEILKRRGDITICLPHLTVWNTTFFAIDRPTELFLAEDYARLQVDLWGRYRIWQIALDGH